jgi:hypothetical protein
MAIANCMCGHEKRDHRPQRSGMPYGACRICLCNLYQVIHRAPEHEVRELKAEAPVIEWVLERLSSKCCPQGLNVMAEELRWLGLGSMTYLKLLNAVNTEIGKPQSRIAQLSGEVYWFSGKSTPADWSLKLDRRMLPCFYRRYPPDIPWDELENPENILPSPANLGQTNSK